MTFNLRAHARLLLAMLPVLAATACAPADVTPGDDDPSSAVDEVVGGRSESGYLAAGYLAVGDSARSLEGPNCGAVLIGPRTAVTAAHCIVALRERRAGQPTVFGVGFGDVSDGQIYAATRVSVHPSYRTVGTAAAPRYLHDVAVLQLAAVVEGITPATIAPATEGCASRYVGYGRTTSGGVNVSAGYTGERKSAWMCETSSDALTITVTGRTGGLCWGDSGGGLMVSGRNAVLGVLADFGNNVYRCESGNTMIFTRLAGEMAFIRGASADL